MTSGPAAQSGSRAPITDVHARDPATVEAHVFKQAMRRLASGVTVITTGHQEALYGMTATAVCSASAEPPLLLATLARNSRTHQVIRKTRTFAVNLLREEHDEVATYFASSAEKSFLGIRYRIGATGCPLIENCLAWLECALHSTHEVGTHTILVGRVTDVTIGVEGEALVLHEGTFAKGLSAQNLAR